MDLVNRGTQPVDRVDRSMVGRLEVETITLGDQ